MTSKPTKPPIPPPKQLSTQNTTISTQNTTISTQNTTISTQNATISTQQFNDENIIYKKNILNFG